MLLSTRETASRQYCCRQRTTTQTRLYAVTQQPASTGSAPSSLMNLVPWAIKNGIEVGGHACVLCCCAQTVGWG